MKRGFTLVEVSLAMMIMAGASLAVVGLYGLGFRENTQSREDVAGAALADAVVGPLVMAIQSQGNRWDSLKGEFTLPGGGWKDYMNSDYRVETDPTSRAKAVYTELMGKLTDSEGKQSSFPSSGFGSANLGCGLVIHHEEGSSVVTIALRTVDLNHVSTLMSQPLYFTEVRFQGKSYE